jgi:hypothetical protein
VKVYFGDKQVPVTLFQGLNDPLGRKGPTIYARPGFVVFIADQSYRGKVIRVEGVAAGVEPGSMERGQAFYLGFLK